MLVAKVKLFGGVRNRGQDLQGWDKQRQVLTPNRTTYKQWLPDSWSS